MPDTARGLGIDPMNPQQALTGAANLMKSYLDKYAGDWSKALAAYNAGPGNVDTYGGVPPFEETRGYVSTILGGAQNLVQQTKQAGLTAVNTAQEGLQSAQARVSQFGMGLSSGDAIAFCGPAAAMAFAKAYGRNPTVEEAKQLAVQVGWNANQGMAGVSSEVSLLKNLGIDAHATQGVDWGQVAQSATSGNPVVIDTPGHYYYVDGFNAATGKLHVGTSGTDLKGGSEWMSPDQINGMSQSEGSARAAIFADHPSTAAAKSPDLTSQILSTPSSSTSSPYGPLTMGTMQPAGPSGPSGADQAFDLLTRTAGNVRQQAQDVTQAVLNVGGPPSLTDMGQGLLGGAQDLLARAPQLPGIGAPDIVGAGANLGGQLPSYLQGLSAPDIASSVGGGLPDITGLLANPPSAAQVADTLGSHLPDVSGALDTSKLMFGGASSELGRAAQGLPLSATEQLKAFPETLLGYEQARGPMAAAIDPLRSIPGVRDTSLPSIAEQLTDPTTWVGTGSVRSGLGAVASVTGAIALQDAAQAMIPDDDPNKELKVAVVGLLGGFAGARVGEHNVYPLVQRATQMIDDMGPQAVEDILRSRQSAQARVGAASGADLLAGGVSPTEETVVQDAKQQLDVKSGGIRAAQATQSMQEAIAAIKPQLTPEQVTQATTDWAALPRVGTRVAGLPPGIETPEDLAALRVHLNQLVDDGAAGKDWYSNSGKKILAAVGGDRVEAEKLAQVVAMMARNVDPEQNINYAIEAWNQSKAGGPVQNVHRFKDVSQSAHDLLMNGIPWGGRKTNSFYVNLMEEIDPEFLKQRLVTNDIWINRAFGNTGKAPTGAQYNFMENEMRRMADERGERPSQIQAQMWVGQMARQAPNANGAADFSHGLAQRMAQIGWETAPGTGEIPGYAQASPEAQAAYNHDVGSAFNDPQTGVDEVTRALGGLGGSSFEAPGVWLGDVTPGWQTRVAVAQSPKSTPGGQVVKPASKATIEAIAAAKGWLLSTLPDNKQNAVGWTQVFPAVKIADANAMNVDAGRLLTVREAQELSAGLTQNMSTAAPLAGEEVPFIMTSTERGAWLRNTSDMPNQAFHKAVGEAVDGIQSEADIRGTPVRADSGLIYNDWSKNPNGEVYLDAIRRGGREGAFRAIQDSLGERIATAQRDAAARHFGPGGSPADVATGATQASPQGPNVRGGAQAGAINPRFAADVAGGVGGAAYGWNSADDNASPQDRAQRAALFGALGAGGAHYGGAVAEHALTAGPATGSITPRQWASGIYRGGVISGFGTAADVAANATLTPLTQGIAGGIRDIAAGSPQRLVGRALGAQAGAGEWLKNFQAGWADVLTRPASGTGARSSPGSLTARAGGGIPGIIAMLSESPAALHNGFMNATAELMAALENGAAAGDAAGGLGGTAWRRAFDAVYASPTADTLARAQGAGQRVAGKSDLGFFTGGLANMTTKLGVVGDALFPVVKMGMVLTQRAVEASPLGLVGTGIDVARGRLAGAGPYADLATRGMGSAFDIVPKGNAVGPLGERLTNNLVGTVFATLLGYEALQGNITGQGPNDPAAHRAWIADGNQVNSIKTPAGTYSWDKLPPQLKGPFMAAGAFADAHTTYQQVALRGSAAAPEAYGVQDPTQAAAMHLVLAVSHQLASSTPLRTIGNIWDALQSPKTGTDALQNAATSTISQVAGGVMPLSGAVRSIAQMTDPMAREPLPARMLNEVPQNILQNVEQNIPGLRGNVPIRLDTLGREVRNPLEGLGEFSPLRRASGEQSPILDAMAKAGVAPSAPPPAVPYGSVMQIPLSPEDQRAWLQMRGQLIQDMAGSLVGGRNFDPASVAGRYALNAIDQAATRVTNAQILSYLESRAPGRDLSQIAEPTPGGVLSPVMSYGGGSSDDLMGQQIQANLNARHQALMQALTAPSAQQAPLP